MRRKRSCGNSVMSVMAAVDGQQEAGCTDGVMPYFNDSNADYSLPQCCVADTCTCTKSCESDGAQPRLGDREGVRWMTRMLSVDVHSSPEGRAASRWSWRQGCFNLELQIPSTSGLSLFQGLHSDSVAPSRVHTW
jgi:hypothetical protein